jgi:hypothetical protein
VSSTAVGITSILDAPPLVAPRYGLLSVPGVEQEGPGRWQNGVNTFGEPAQEPWTWDPCSTGTFRVKPEESLIGTERFDPFGVGLTVTCSRLGAPADLSDRLERALRAKLSFAIERAISRANVVTSNGWLGDTNMDALASGGAVTPDVGLSYLENAIGAEGVHGIIHADPATVAAWGFDKVRVVGDHLETVNGTFVASGGGYIGSDPASGSTPAEGQSWAYATAGLEVRLTDPNLITGDESEVLDRALNDLVYHSESYVLATWDHEVLQAGVLIDWTPA